VLVLVAVLANLLVDALSYRNFWLQSKLQPGQLMQGYFEELPHRVGVVLEEELATSITPDISQDAAGNISVPPGNIVGIPLPPGIELQVRSTRERGVPYLVLGKMERLPELQPAWVTLAMPKRLAGRELVAVDWDAGRPWRFDAAWLEAIASRCGVKAEPATVIVEGRAQDVVLKIGECAAHIAVSPVDRVLAVVAGPDWNVIERLDGWHSRVYATPPTLVVLMVLSLLRIACSWFALGGIATTAIALTVASVSLWNTVPAMLSGILATSAVILIAVWRGLALMFGVRWRWAATIVWLLLMVGAGGAGLKALMHAAHASVRELDESERRASCLVTGYSSAAGTALRWGTQGLTGWLKGECRPCGGSVTQLAQAGGTLHWLRDHMCSHPLTSTGAEVVFLGSANDDFLYWIDAAGDLTGTLRRVATLGSTVYSENPGLPGMRKVFGDAAQLSWALVEEQLARIREVLGCIRADGNNLIFAHDFLVLDLPAGRDDLRQRMMERKRAAVEDAGGTFVDLYDEFRDEAGVAWFNDFIHFSTIGHRRIAERVCTSIEGEGGPPTTSHFIHARTLSALARYQSTVACRPVRSGVRALQPRSRLAFVTFIRRSACPSGRLASQTIRPLKPVMFVSVSTTSRIDVAVPAERLTSSAPS
jgi:hypothetical protein